MAKNRKPIPKTQKEISKTQHSAYDSTQGNPNDAILDPKSRILQQSWKGDTVKPYTVGIQDIDEAIFYYLENVIKPTVTQNGEKISVPVLYGSPEKWKSYQKDGYLRDLKGSLMAPLIIFKRNNIEKVRTVANKLDANNPNHYGIFEKRYSTRNAYNAFDALNGSIPEKQYYAVVVPDYITVTYQFVVFTYYVDQLNKIVEAIEYASDAYWGNPERFKFQARINSFGFQTELAENSERIVRSTFEVRLNGYIVPDVQQKDVTAISKFNNKTKISVFLETTSDSEQFTATVAQTRRTNPTAFIDSNIIPGSGGGGGINPNDLLYLNTNKQLTGTVSSTDTVTFASGWIAAPTGFPATSLDNFTFFCNGSLIEKSAILSFTEAGGVSTLVVDNTELGYGFAVSDEIIGIGKFINGD